MTLDRWLSAAVADARSRGLERLVPLLETLGRSIGALRDACGYPHVVAPPKIETASASARPSRAGAVRAAAAARPYAGSTATGQGRLTIRSFAARLRTREITSAQAVESCLQRIAERNETLNAFILVLADEARAAAREADREIAGGIDRGLLHGVPVSIKDLFDMRGTATTAASRVREGHVADEDAALVARLRAAGAVIVGKTNLHEFALGTTNEESAYGPVKNPYDLTRSPGGSSGGSAASVADGMALATLGSDTGGSIRIPSAACGLVGLKPTAGELPLHGCVPLSTSLDHAGPLALTVTDAGLMFDALMARPSRTRVPAALQGLRLGVPRRYFLERLDAEVEERFAASIAALEAAGVRVADVDIPLAELTAAVYVTIAFPEAAAYHAPFLEASADRYTEPVRLRLEMAGYVLGEDYVRARALRERMRAGVDTALASCDALVLPTLPVPATPLGASTVRVGGRDEPVRNITLRLTQLFNITGHPAVSMPCGHTQAGLPVGLQLVGLHHATDALLETALAVEAVLSPGVDVPAV